MASGAGGPEGSNKLLMRFVPKQPGSYAGELLLTSALDVRVYELAGQANAPGMQASLEFSTAARLPVKQELPIVNGMDVDWNVTASLKAESFRGPTSVKIPPKSTGHYPLEFCPDWVGESTGELVLTNTTTGDRYIFKLRGVGEEPLSEGHLVFDGQVRQPQPLAFRVFNVASDGQPCELSVESDLLHVAGPPTASVGAVRGKNDGERGESEYTLTVNPQISGVVQGSLTFSAADGRYLWYTIEVRAAPPAREALLPVVTPVHKVVAVEIPIVNPSSQPLDFEVAVSGDGLLGDETITVPAGPDSTAMYSLLFSPLTAGVSYGSVAFVNPIAGEFWYELQLEAEAAVPVSLPLLECAVGGSTTHRFTVANPVGEELTLKATSDNPRNFGVAAPGGGAIVLQPYAEATLEATFTPSALGDEQSASISLTHPKLGEWIFLARGVGKEPSQMAPTEVTAPLGQMASATVAFANPFDTALHLAVSIADADGDDALGSPTFSLLLRRTTGLLIGARGQLQIPFTFNCRDMSERRTELIIHSEYNGRPLRWRFPVSGVAVSRPLPKPLPLRCRARAPLHELLELPIPGLDEFGGDEPFSFELDVAAEHAAVLGKTLVLTPQSRTLSGTHLLMDVDWRPLRPLRSTVALVVNKASGGRWRYELALEAGEAEADDVISIEAAIGKTSAVSFKLSNVFEADAAFIAYFTPESPAVFSVRPPAGILSSAGSDGQLFTVGYSPTEYGKALKGTLLITTDEMQWVYEVRGAHPHYEAPRVTMATVDSKQSKEARAAAARLRASHGTKNFVSAAARSPDRNARR
jgi:hypothetical protein